MIRWRVRLRADPAAETAEADLAPPQEALTGAGPLKNTAFGLLTQVTTSVFTAGLTVYLARALGESGYGVFALALTVSAIALLASDAGVSQAAARFVAERYTDRPAAADAAAAALRLNVVAAVAAAVLLWVLAAPIAAAFVASALKWPLRGIAVAVIGQSLLMLYLRIFSSVRRVRLGVAVVFVESLMETTASIALVALGGGVTGAAFGRAIGYAFGAAAAMVVGGRLLGRRAFALRARGDTRTRDIARYAGPLLITNSAYTIYGTIDSLLIASLLTTSAVGLFSGPVRLVVLLGYVGESVAGAVGPRVVRTPDHEPDAVTWRAGVRWLLIFQSALVAPLLMWATPIIVLLLGQGFHASGPVLRCLALFAFLRGLSPVMSISVNYLGGASKRIPIVLLTLLVNIALDVTLLPLIGVIGAAIGTGVAYVIYVTAHFRLCRQAFDVPMGPLVRTAARSGLAATAMALVLLAVGTSHLSPLQWVTGLAGGTVAFGLVLLATGELNRDELRTLIGLVRGRVATV